MDKKPNFVELNFSSSMGPKLRQLVEKQLLDDLLFYNLETKNLKFDWSESCIEGNDTKYLDGSLENFSGILLYDNNENIIVDGWMEFIHAGDFFIVYWDMLTILQDKKEILDINKPGIPDHIWVKIPKDIQPNYILDRK